MRSRHPGAPRAQGERIMNRKELKKREKWAVVASAGLELALLALVMLAGGCSNAAEGAVSGGGIGALSGLAIGSLTGNAGAGAAVGAVVGGVGGAVVGD